MSVEQAEARFASDPFAKHLGMNLVDIAHEHAVVALPYQPEHANAVGPVNGGATASLLNVAAKAAAWTGIDLDRAPYLACVDMTVQYLSAAIEELDITCQHYSPGRIQMHMPGIEALMDARGQIHDGALASVIDVCGTAAAWSLVPGHEGARGSTIGMQISYTQATAEAVVADAHIQQRSEEIFFSTVYVTAVTSGQLVAMGQVSYRLVEPR